MRHLLIIFITFFLFLQTGKALAPSFYGTRNEAHILRVLSIVDHHFTEGSAFLEEFPEYRVFLPHKARLLMIFMHHDHAKFYGDFNEFLSANFGKNWMQLSGEEKENMKVNKAAMNQVDGPLMSFLSEIMEISRVNHQDKDTSSKHEISVLLEVYEKVIDTMDRFLGDAAPPDKMNWSDVKYLLEVYNRIETDPKEKSPEFDKNQTRSTKFFEGIESSTDIVEKYEYQMHLFIEDPTKFLYWPTTHGFNRHKYKERKRSYLRERGVDLAAEFHKKANDPLIKEYFLMSSLEIIFANDPTEREIEMLKNLPHFEGIGASEFSRLLEGVESGSGKGDPSKSHQGFRGCFAFFK